MQSDDDGSSTHKFTGKLAWEKPITEKETVGYFLGLSTANRGLKGRLQEIRMTSVFLSAATSLRKSAHNFSWMDMQHMAVLGTT